MAEDTASTRKGVLPGAPTLIGQEVELKLLTDPVTLERLIDAPVIIRNARSKGSTQKLEATYFDTPDAALAQCGASLRVRRSGRQHIQTLKLAAGESPLQRRELESPVAEMSPQFELLPMNTLGAPFETLQIADIAPVFTSKVRRQLRTIDFGGATIEIAFDLGTLAAGERTEELCEIELELKAGDAGALYDLALSLLELGPLRVGLRSKAERGYALACGDHRDAQKAASLRIEPDDTADEVIVKVLESCQRHVVANLAAALEGQHPDSIHQLRVALRRLRTAISLICNEIPANALRPLNTEARRLARTLGPVRNWDVFLTSTIAEIERAKLPGIEFGATKAVLAPFRMRSYALASADLVGVECTRFLLSLGRTIQRKSWRNDVDIEALTALTQPAHEFVGRALSRLHRKTLKKGSRLGKLPPAGRHSLRLALKKLRYGAEFFLPLYDAANVPERYVKRMSELQDILGSDNDATTTQSLLIEVGDGTADLTVHRAIGAIIGWQGRERIEASRNLRRAWRRFSRSEPFW